MTWFRNLRQDIRAAFEHPDLFLIGLVATAAMLGSQYIPRSLAAQAGSMLYSVVRTLSTALPNQGWVKPGAHLLRGVLYLTLTLASVPLLKSRPKELGWSLGRWRTWLPDTGILLLATLPLVLWASHQPSFQHAYPYFNESRYGFAGFAMCMLVRAVYMFGWEFLFRGYLLFGFERRAGPAAAIVVSTIPFALMHIGKPAPEVWGSIAAGLILGILALRGRSFLPAALLHFLVATALDTLVLTI
ncbi:MAG: CPBP family intramembrane glutamic endopeptidase [candidate division WOR-3 bacterium]